MKQLSPRPQFERWAASYGYPAFEWRDGEYTNPVVQAVWRGWLLTRGRRVI